MASVDSVTAEGFGQGLRSCRPLLIGTVGVVDVGGLVWGPSGSYPFGLPVERCGWGERVMREERLQLLV